MVEEVSISINIIERVVSGEVDLALERDEY